MKNKQTIKCDVKDCKFNNQQQELCELNAIKVSSNACDCDNKQSTICDSFEVQKGE